MAILQGFQAILQDFKAILQGFQAILQLLESFLTELTEKWQNFKTFLGYCVVYELQALRV